MSEQSFEEDLQFLSGHFETFVLKNAEGSRVAVVPALQGRTMTSSTNGDAGQSHGYIKYDVFEQKELDPAINLYGGEDRIWISPEGGQFSVYFDPDVEMTFGNWRTPPFLDTVPWDVLKRDDQSITMEQSAALMNMSGYTFEIKLTRTVELLEKSTIAGNLNAELGSLNVVGHESHNVLTNIGSETWQQETGLIGLWSLCMSKPAEQASLIVPFRRGDASELGKIVEAGYFGELDGSRLTVNEELGLIFLRGDGDFRSKLGLSEKRALPLLGSWDPQRNVLTIVQFSMPETAQHGYTNNLWKYQDEPYAGDVINGYNDGPNESGGKLGGFFELETVSPALALAAGESYTHLQRTIRLEGAREELDRVAQSVFGASLDVIESQLVAQTA